MNKLKRTCLGLRAVVKYEGVISLITRGYRFLLNQTFLFDEYYVIYTDLSLARNSSESDFLPKTDSYSLKMISTNREADELVAEGFDFGAYDLNLRASLDRGALVFCIFILALFYFEILLKDLINGNNECLNKKVC